MRLALFALLGLALGACNTHEPEHCEGTKIVECTSSSHQPDPGCRERKVRDCADDGAVCLDSPEGPYCVEPERTCSLDDLTFCEANTVRICRYGGVSVDDVDECVAEQTCLTRRLRTGGSESFCGYWADGCVEGAGRCYSDSVAVTCRRNRWSERTYCEPGSECVDGACSPAADDDDAGAR